MGPLTHNEQAGRDGTLTARGRERLKVIQRTAAALFLNRGFAAVTLDEIAQASGGSKSMLYEHFRSKEALFRASMEQVANELRSKLAKAPSESATLNILTADPALSLGRLALSERQFPELAKTWTCVLSEAREKHNLDETMIAFAVYKALLGV